MALSLPNNISFVPLDVLTAEELNQVIQNIDFIAEQFPIAASSIGSGAIGTNQLANGAVTSDKISYSSVFKAIYGGSSVSQALTTSYSDVASSTVSSMPIGASFFAIAKVGFTGSDTVTSVSTRLRYGSNYGSVGASTTAWGRNLDTWGLFTKTSTNSVYIQAMKDNSSSVNVTNYEFLAFRVG